MTKIIQKVSHVKWLTKLYRKWVMWNDQQNYTGSITLTRTQTLTLIHINTNTHTRRHRGIHRITNERERESERESRFRRSEFLCPADDEKKTSWRSHWSYSVFTSFLFWNLTLPSTRREAVRTTKPFITSVHVQPLGHFKSLNHWGLPESAIRCRFIKDATLKQSFFFFFFFPPSSTLLGVYSKPQAIIHYGE